MTGGVPSPGTWLRYLRVNARRLVVVVVVALLLSAGLVAAYFGTPHRSADWATDAVAADGDVRVSERGGGYVLRPDEGPSRTGLVFYPGGRVAPDAYLHTLAPLAARANVTVVVPSMPLNLAVLDRDAAASVRSSYPAVDRWYVGGHSLGGAMACRYAAANPGAVAGVVLYAAYCDRPLPDGMAALTVTGTRDGVLNRAAVRENRDNLPPNATVVPVRGVNHSQFGSYSGQRGDRPGTVTYREAHRRVANATLAWVANRTGPAAAVTPAVARRGSPRPGRRPR